MSSEPNAQEEEARRKKRAERFGNLDVEEARAALGSQPRKDDNTSPSPKRIRRDERSDSRGHGKSVRDTVVILSPEPEFSDEEYDWSKSAEQNQTGPSRANESNSMNAQVWDAPPNGKETNTTDHWDEQDTRSREYSREPVAATSSDWDTSAATAAHAPVSSSDANTVDGNGDAGALDFNMSALETWPSWGSPLRLSTGDDVSTDNHRTSSRSPPHSGYRGGYRGGGRGGGGYRGGRGGAGGGGRGGRMDDRRAPYDRRDDYDYRSRDRDLRDDYSSRQPPPELNRFEGRTRSPHVRSRSPPMAAYRPPSPRGRSPPRGYAPRRPLSPPPTAAHHTSMGSRTAYRAPQDSYDRPPYRRSRTPPPPAYNRPSYPPSSSAAAAAPPMSRDYRGYRDRDPAARPRGGAVLDISRYEPMDIRGTAPMPSSVHRDMRHDDRQYLRDRDSRDRRDHYDARDPRDVRDVSDFRDRPRDNRPPYADRPGSRPYSPPRAGGYPPNRPRSPPRRGDYGGDYRRR